MDDSSIILNTIITRNEQELAACKNVVVIIKWYHSQTTKCLKTVLA